MEHRSRGPSAPHEADVVMKWCHMTRHGVRAQVSEAEFEMRSHVAVGTKSVLPLFSPKSWSRYYLRSPPPPPLPISRPHPRRPPHSRHIAMLLHSKQPQAPHTLNSMSHHSHSHTHRRLQSASLTVYPTLTPGLLTLSKPITQAPRDSPAANSSTKKQTHSQKIPPPKSAKKQKGEQQQPPAENAQAVPAASVTVTPDVVAPASDSRGRSVRAGSSNQRSASQSAPHSRSSNKAAAKDPDAAAHSDDGKPSRKQPRPQSNKITTAPSTPLLSTEQPAATVGVPSGKLARNRRARHKSLVFNLDSTQIPSIPPRTPSPRTNAVPIPPSRKGATSPRQNLSKSAPLGVSDWDEPLTLRGLGLSNDDATDAAERERMHELQARAALDKLFMISGPRTAPLTGPASASFPTLSPPPSPTIHRARSNRPKHQRAPSQPLETMVFNTDEDVFGPTPATSVPTQSTSVPNFFAGSGSASAPATPQRTRARRNNTLNGPLASASLSFGYGVNLSAAFAASSPAVISGPAGATAAANGKGGKGSMWAGSAFMNAPDAADLPMPKFLE